MSDIEESQPANITDNLDKAAALKTKMEVLKEKLPHIAEDFIKYYTFFTKNSENQEYKQMFENIQKNLEKVNAELFMVENKIDKNTQTINKDLFKLDIEIKKDKKKNMFFKSRLGMLANEYNGSTEMVSDYKQMYDSHYLRNFSMIIGILISSALLTKLFTDQTHSETS